ncbi:MAG: EI24 domain-containing protein [Rhodospirillaceae bacterium]
MWAMIDAFIKGVQQLGDKYTRRPLCFSIGAALAIFAGLWAAAFGLFKYTAFFSIPWIETVADWLGGIVVLILTWALFPGVVSAVVTLFLEQIAEQVERRHYPSLPAAAGQSAGEQVATALRFLGLVVLLNLLLLPFILLGPAYPLLYYTVNGYLLGREYFEIIAARRLAARDVAMIRRQRSSYIFMAGVAIALLLTVPIVNFLTPVIATAAMVHLFQRYRGDAGRMGAGQAEAGGPGAAPTTQPAVRPDNSVLDGTRQDA